MTDTAAESTSYSKKFVRKIWTGAAIACSAILTVSAFGLVSTHHNVMVEVDGVSRPVEVWGTSVADALNSADIKVNNHDKVFPSLDSRIPSDKPISVLTAHPYSVIVDGKRVELWSTAKNSSSILADLNSSGRTVTIAATRGSERSPLSTLSVTDTKGVIEVDGKKLQVEIPANTTVSELLAAQKISTSPIDRIQVGAEGGLLTIKIQRVSRANQVEETAIPFKTEERDDNTLEKGKTKVETEGVAGKHVKVTYRETVDGKVTHETVVKDADVSQPVTKVVRKGTKKPAPVSSPATGAKDFPIIADSNAPGTTPAGAQAIAHGMVSARGWSDAEFQCLVSLWNRESGWNYKSLNRSSGAFGIPQSLPGRKMASAGADWQTNPATQIRWGLGYIQGRYGTPCSALNHSHRVGWY